MKFKQNILLIFPVLFLSGLCPQCQSPSATKSSPDKSLFSLIQQSPYIVGKTNYLNSPYLTAGDRVYMVGHQDGQFPDLGWHVSGEMGGIWNHPIKLMDGFSLEVNLNQKAYCLNKADTFINYPFANVHRYIQSVPDMHIDRFQFVPDGKEALVIEFTLKNLSNTLQKTQLNFQAMVDLRPVWLGERTGMTDSRDQISWDESAQCLVAKDSLQEWYTAWNANIKPANQQIQRAGCSFERKGLGSQAGLLYHIALPPKSRFVFRVVIAGSYKSRQNALQTLEEVQKNASALLIAKKSRYEKLTQTARLNIPDPELQQVFEWVKYNTDWLIRDVPEIGRGLSAGLPDYPWWFGCDNAYSLQGVLASGRSDLVYSTLELLKKISEKTNGNGRIIHEVSTNGAVYNPGNINETPQFASLVWKAYQWTGNQKLLDQYYPFIKKGLHWLYQENDTDKNLYPDGPGMMEIQGLESEMIDVASYTQKAFADAAQMAQIMGEADEAKNFQKIADALKKKINADFWVEEFSSYADFIGTPTEANQLIEAALIRADTLQKPWAIAELKQSQKKIAAYPPDQKRGFVLYHNWVVNTPMETGIAPADKAERALKTGSQFVNPFGVFVTGIDRDESAGKNEGSFAEGKKIFSYVGAVMTLPTGVQAIAENNYTNPDQALSYLKRMSHSFSYALPGSMYEVSPDFGMMTQAWSIYSLAVPIVQQFFGIQPKAYTQRIHISPQMPSTWEKANLENLPIGDNSVSMYYELNNKTLKITILQEKSNWKIRISLPKGKYSQWQLQGASVQAQTAENKNWIETSGKKIVLVLNH